MYSINYIRQISKFLNPIRSYSFTRRNKTFLHPFFPFVKHKNYIEKNFNNPSQTIFERFNSIIYLCTMQLSGLAIIIVGALVLSDVAELRQFLEGRIIAPPIILIITGTVVFVIAFLGCYGAIKENYLMLIAVRHFNHLSHFTFYT